MPKEQPPHPRFFRRRVPFEGAFHPAPSATPVLSPQNTSMLPRDHHVAGELGFAVRALLNRWHLVLNGMHLLASMHPARAIYQLLTPSEYNIISSWNPVYLRSRWNLELKTLLVSTDVLQQ
jgi:hypothetical protein